MGGYGGRFQWSITIWILVVNAGCFILQSILSPALLQKYIYLSVDGIKSGFVWQLLTFQFMHGGFTHLLLNALGIFFIGRAVERQMAPDKFIFLYLFSGVVGGILQIVFLMVAPTPFGGFTLGASAGLFGLLGAFGIILGHEIISILLFFILPVSFPGRLLIPLGIIVSVLGMIGDKGHVAHAAHLGGMLGAILYLKYILDKTPGFSFSSLFSGKKSANIIKGTNFRSSKSKAKSVDGNPVSQSEPSRQKTDDEEINKILDKIYEKGIHSITAEERKKLENARSNLKKSP